VRHEMHVDHAAVMMTPRARILAIGGTPATSGLMGVTRFIKHESSRDAIFKRADTSMDQIMAAGCN
jgi:hypothetical protein